MPDCIFTVNNGYKTATDFKEDLIFKKKWEFWLKVISVPKTGKPMNISALVPIISTGMSPLLLSHILKINRLIAK